MRRQTTQKLGEILTKKKDYAAAATIFREALELALRSQQPDHPLVQSIADQLRDLLTLQDEEDTVDSLLHEILKAQRQPVP